jgi:endonuclease-3
MAQKDLKYKIEQIIFLLKKAYPDVGPRLKFSNPLECLVSGILASQCTDEKVNEVTVFLFDKYKTARDYADADLVELMNEIYSTGTFRKKAERIKECCDIIDKQYGGKVPNDMDSLVSLPGVGRKTANMIIADAFGKPGIIVDTHVIRLSERIGLSDKKMPDKIEFDLKEIVSENEWTIFSHLMAFHGSRTCIARKPKCEICCINEYCDYFNKNH